MHVWNLGGGGHTLSVPVPLGACSCVAATLRPPPTTRLAIRSSHGTRFRLTAEAPSTEPMCSSACCRGEYVSSMYPNADTLHTRGR